MPITLSGASCFAAATRFRRLLFSPDAAFHAISDAYYAADADATGVRCSDDAAIADAIFLMLPRRRRFIVDMLSMLITPP